MYSTILRAVTAAVESQGIPLRYTIAKLKRPEVEEAIVSNAQLLLETLRAVEAPRIIAFLALVLAASHVVEEAKLAASESTSEQA